MKMTRYCSRSRTFLDINVPFLFALKSPINIFFIGRVCDFDGDIFDISKSNYIAKPKPDYDEFLFKDC